MSWLFRSTEQAARDALAELAAAVAPSKQALVTMRDDVRKMTPRQVSTQIAEWIQDAQSVNEWRVILKRHGF